jgi:hypothetical protein
MKSDDILIQKLDEFTRKYYKNQLIRGVIYSLGFTLAFFLTVALLEYFGNFGTTIRTILYYSFIVGVLAIGVNWIIIPITKLYNLGKVISREKAADIIGHHFSDVKDKLLNVLQLRENSAHIAGSEILIEAAINQKISELKPVPFTAAIDLNQNKKYLKYVLAPLLVIIILLFAAPSIITESTKRLVKHETYFEKQAPFTFAIENQLLQGIQQEDFELKIKITGNEIPDVAYIEIENNQYKLDKIDKLHFAYLFKNLPKTTQFKLNADGFYSKNYELKAILKPTVLGFEIELSYPGYLNKKNEVLSNTGDITIPSGTKVTWQIKTENTNEMKMVFADTNITLKQVTDVSYSYSKFLFKNETYALKASNNYIKNSNAINYSINVIPDAFPLIKVEEQNDSNSFKHVYFKGNVKDDYGFNSLAFVYKKSDTDSVKDQKEIRVNLAINKTLVQDNFIYHWNLAQIGLNAGEAYEYYFEVRDNDAINGYKITRSQRMVFKAPTQKEIAANAEKDNKKVKDELTSSIQKAKELQREMNEMNKKLIDKKTLNYNDIKQLKDLLEKQKNLQQKVENIEKENKENFEKQSEFNKPDDKLLEKQQLLEELMKNLMTEEMKEKMKELEKLLQQMDKEKTQDALEKMKLDAKDLEKEMDRTLELFKQMEFEKKLDDAIKNLDKLADEQEKLAEKTENKEEKQQDLEKKQDELNKKFDDLKKDLEDLKKKNEELAEPNKMESSEEQQKDIKKDMENSSDEMKQKQNKKASKSQKSAAEKMKKMSQKMQEEQAEAEDEGEDAEALRQILENLISVSFTQENLINKAKTIDRTNPQYLKLIQEQKKIKDDAKMIEDSLFALSKRQVKIQSIVNREIADINSNMAKSIKNLEDRFIPAATSRQQYVMTSVNNLALLLSEALAQMNQQMQQKKDSKPGSGSCKKPGGSGSKPSMSKMKSMQEQINKQIAKLKEQMAKEKGKEGEKGKEKGKAKGNGAPGGEGGMSESLAKLAAQQESLRRELQKASDKMNKDGKQGNGSLQKLAEEMEKTETDLVNKRISQETINRQQDILTRLLEAEKAERERDLDEKRESKEPQNEIFRNPNQFLEYNLLKQKEAELLQTVPPALNQYYKNKVNEYFNNFD